MDSWIYVSNLLIGGKGAVPPNRMFSSLVVSEAVGQPARRIHTGSFSV
jgi:hypothetical protein